MHGDDAPWAFWWSRMITRRLKTCSQRQLYSSAIIRTHISCSLFYTYSQLTVCLTVNCNLSVKGDDKTIWVLSEETSIIGSLITTCGGSTTWQFNDQGKRLVGLRKIVISQFYSYENQLRQNTPEVEDIEIATLKINYFGSHEENTGKEKQEKEETMIKC